MKRISVVDVILWTFRRNEHDVIRMYESLSDIMMCATGGDMLNFGYWDADVTGPVQAQQRLCSEFGKFARLSAGQEVVDVGSGYGSPALQWHSEYGPMRIVSLNISKRQLDKSPQHMPQVNATSTRLPFRDTCADRIVAFESAQHFRPLNAFFAESFRILKDQGILAVAIPVAGSGDAGLVKMGLVHMTWSSEHYTREDIVAGVQDAGFVDCHIRDIGGMIYPRLARYYQENRDSLRDSICDMYPSYVEEILYRSMCRIERLSQRGVIKYLLVRASKPA